ncbi:MAG TPA: cupin domain-containing protein [Candidatus Acidoferrales bacterium]|nr:cupin domain-containing protein [Candidatus Acidoferrales bacterium]
MKRVALATDLYAFIFFPDDFRPGAQFFSESEWSLQIGLLMFPPGHAIAAHAHLPQTNPRTQPTQEFLLVASGQMETDFFTEDGRFFQTETLSQGCILFQIRGGHAFRFLEPTRLIEVKSGPYLGRDKDKILLDVNDTSFSAETASPRDRNSI